VIFNASEEVIVPRHSVKRVDPCPQNCPKENGCRFNAEVSWTNKKIVQGGSTTICAEDLVFKVLPDGSDKCKPGWSFDLASTDIFFTFTDLDGTTTRISPEALDESHRREMNPPAEGAPAPPPLRFDLEGSSGADQSLIIRGKGTLKEFSINVTIKCYCSCREFEPPGTSKDLTINELVVSVPFKSYQET
jgi:hypothetical protein